VETSKLTFKIQELPDGKSSRSVSLNRGDLALSDEVVLDEGLVEIEFYKTNHFIEVKFKVDVEAELTCDRSLKLFYERLEASYHVLFEPNPVENTETDKGAVRQIPADHLLLDIEKLVRDTIMLEVPARKIHPDYLDDEGKLKEFETQTFGPEADEDETIDPRWSALKKLK
jgi:uncharacterized metal-binding protein YceD (DUF177 family)